MSKKERPPISDVIEVKDSETIYKTEKWWCSVVLGTMFNRTKVFVYLHRFENGKWKRKGKMTIGSQKNWDGIKEAVERFLPQAFGGA